MPDESAPIRAPELTGAVDWLNVDAPLTLADLRGKVVLLDFWTYGCVNCMHLLPGLARLEAKYRDALVVIGVHSAKFANERDSGNLRLILEHYGITHPVANDAELKVWREYTVRAWPTLVLIDPAGYIVAGASGEGRLDAFDEAIAAVIQVFSDKGELDPTPRPATVHPTPAGTTLLFPGKVAVDPDGRRLFIADSSHHRIVVVSVTGERLDVVGGDGAGSADGSFEHATFHGPQGMAYEPDTGRLWVADTGNHLVREVRFETRTVLTVAGTGVQGRRESGGRGIDVSLKSPWDVALHGGLMLVAMAGAHQVWLLDRERSLVLPYAGSGGEARVDGAVDDAAFAQPSGLLINDDVAYVADAESNIIRAIQLPPVNRVTTLAGGDLFEFGDVDGVGDAARFQHPLHVEVDAGSLYVADTYNHKIRLLDPVSRRVTTIAGQGTPGHADGAPGTACFREPGGVAVVGARLYVADTNNHAIRTIELATGEVGTLPIAPAV